MYVLIIKTSDKSIRRAIARSRRSSISSAHKFGCVSFYFNFFNSVQLALVLEDYEPPALRVQGFVSRKKGARSIVEEKKEGEKNNNNEK